MAGTGGLTTYCKTYIIEKEIADVVLSFFFFFGFFDGLPEYFCVCLSYFLCRPVSTGDMCVLWNTLDLGRIRIFIVAFVSYLSLIV